ncbi:hypothetical protein M0R45_038240 [Rubus argutus]|uniref:RWP-RK domain-containing protein n=1 Tax=Rubus argutus TaxID=59490 RepID=A0AAW1W2W7_RUBAR
MEYSTQQPVLPKNEENPLAFSYLEYYYQDPFQNTTSLFEAPQVDNFPNEFDSLALPILEDYNQIPHMGFQGFEDLCNWDFTLDSTTFSSPCHYDYHVLDENTLPTMMDSFDYSNNNVPSDLGHDDVLLMIESSGFSSSQCDSVVFDEKTLTTMDSSDYGNNVRSNLGQHEGSMMIESSGFPSSHCESVMLDEMPISTMVESFDNSNNVPSVLGHHEASMVIESTDSSSGTSSTKRYKTQMKINSGALELEEIKKYFDLPITKAAKELKVGLTRLKRRCRELNIMRWPHRKIRSLNSLIETLKGMGLRTEVKMLEENKRLLEQLPNMELTQRTKKLRQCIFKANHKKKMSFSFFLG